MKKLIIVIVILLLFLCSCQKTLLQTGAGSDGDQLLDSGKNIEAIEFYEKRLEQIIPQYGDDSIEASIIFNNISVAYLNLGENEKSLTYSNKSKLICETLGYERGLAIACSNIGEAYFYKGDYEIALEYYQKTLEIEQRLYGKSSIDAILTVQIMSDAYKKMENYKKSLELLDDIIEIDISENGNKSDSLRHAYRRKGDIYNILKDDINAVRYYKMAIEINQYNETQDFEFEAKRNINIGDIYSEKNPEEAIEYYQKAYDFYTNSQSQDERNLKICYKLMLNYESLNKLETALEFGIKACILAEKQRMGKELTEEDVHPYKEGLKRVYYSLNSDTNFDKWYDKNVLE